MGVSEYQELREGLAVDRSNISNEVERSARLLHRVLYLTARARAALDVAEREKSRALHRLGAAYRDRAKTTGAPTTKDAVDSWVRSSLEYEEPCDEVVRCQEALYLWEALAEAWRARSFTLRDLVKLDLAERERTYIREPETTRRSLQDQQADQPRKRERLT
jgi:glycine/D-amino acid oxidase-like deaminating enzyme